MKLSIALLMVSSTCLSTHAAVAQAGLPGGTTQPIASGITKRNNFVDFVAASNASEIALAQLALRNSRNPAVLEFAQTMKRDREQAEADTMALAKRQGLHISHHIDAGHAKMVTSLESATGSAFDEQYTKRVLADYDEALVRAQAETRVADPEIAKFSQQLEQMLQQHREMAQNLANSLANMNSK